MDQLLQILCILTCLVLTVWVILSAETDIRIPRYFPGPNDFDSYSQ